MDPATYFIIGLFLSIILGVIYMEDYQSRHRKMTRARNEARRLLNKASRIKWGSEEHCRLNYWLGQLFVLLDGYGLLQLQREFKFGSFEYKDKYLHQYEKDVLKQIHCLVSIENMRMRHNSNAIIKRLHNDLDKADDQQEYFPFNIYFSLGMLAGYDGNMFHNIDETNNWWFDHLDQYIANKEWTKLSDEITIAQFNGFDG